MSMVNACAGAEIGDDALREVFALLPGLRDLLCCAATCKRWRRLVADRDFLRRVGLWPDTARRPCVLAGIFSQTYYSHGNPRTNSAILYAPPRFLGLQAGLDVHRLTFDSFVTIDGHDKWVFDIARPVAARRGFLLVRVLLPSSSPSQLHLAVCRPMLDTRSTQFLPSPPFGRPLFFNKNNLEGFAIITPADHAADDGSTSLDLKRRQRQPMFKVLLIFKDYSNGFLCACTNSSDTPDDWSAPVKCCPASGLTMCSPRTGLITHGMVHWLFKNDETDMVYTLNMSIAISHIPFTKTPVKLDATLPRPLILCIAGEEGRFSLVTIQDQGVANLWTSQAQDDDNYVWENSQLTMLGSVRIDMVFFAESRSALLVEQGGVYFIVDLKSKKKMPVRLMDERNKHLGDTRWFPAYSCSSTCCRGHIDSICRYITPVLYEIDWAFISIISSNV